MQGLRFIKRYNLVDGDRVNFNIPAGTYGGLLVRVLATGGVAESLFLPGNANSSEGAVVRVKRAGRQVMGEDLFSLLYMTDYYFGAPIGVAGEDATERGRSIVLPFGLPGLPNAAHVLSSEEMTIDLDVLDVTEFAADATGVEIEFYGILTPGVPEYYTLSTQEQDIISAGSGREEITVNGKNVAAILYADALTGPEDQTALRSIGLRVDGRIVLDNVRDYVFYEASQLWGRAFAGGLAAAMGEDPRMGIVRLADSLREARNSDVQVSFEFQAAGKAKMTSFSILPALNGPQSFDRVRAYMGGLGRVGFAIDEAAAQNSGGTWDGTGVPPGTGGIKPPRGSGGGKPNKPVYM